MPAALTTGHHFSISAFWNAASAAGVCCSRGGTSVPCSASRARMAGVASVSTNTPLTLAMMSFGVPFGAHRPYQSEA